MDLSIGKNISAMRKSKGWSQKQLADMLGVSNKTVSKWENGGGFPDISMLPELARVFDVTIDELFFETPFQSKSQFISSIDEGTSVDTVLASDHAEEFMQVEIEEDEKDIAQSKKQGKCAAKFAKLAKTPSFILSAVLAAVFAAVFVLSFFGVSDYSFDNKTLPISGTMTAIDYVDGAVHCYSLSEEEATQVTAEEISAYAKKFGNKIDKNDSIEEYVRVINKVAEKSLIESLKCCVMSRDTLLKNDYYNMQVYIFFVYDAMLSLFRIIVSFAAFLTSLAYFISVCCGKTGKTKRFIPYLIGLLFAVNMLVLVMPNAFESIGTESGAQKYGMTPSSCAIATAVLSSAVLLTAVCAKAVKTAKSNPMKDVKRFFICSSVAFCLVVTMLGIAGTADVRAEVYGIGGIGSEIKRAREVDQLNWGVYDMSDSLAGFEIVNPEYDENSYKSGEEYLKARSGKLHKDLEGNDSVIAEDYIKLYDAFRFETDEDGLIKESVGSCMVLGTISVATHITMLLLLGLIAAVLAAGLIDGKRRKRVILLMSVALLLAVLLLVCDSIIAAMLDGVQNRFAYLNMVFAGEKPIVWAAAAIISSITMLCSAPRKKAIVLTSAEDYQKFVALIPDAEKLAQ